MIREIPTQPLQSQTLTVDLGGQPVRINIYQKDTGLYCDIKINDVAILTGVIARESNKMVRDAYLDFVGDLAFYDLEGTDDPQFWGLGTRWVLVYVY